MTGPCFPSVPGACQENDLDDGRARALTGMPSLRWRGGTRVAGQEVLRRMRGEEGACREAARCRARGRQKRIWSKYCLNLEEEKP